jgi:hypothetical protein
MSRGYGQLQRTLLALLSAHEQTTVSAAHLADGLDTIELAHLAYGKLQPEFFKFTTNSQEIAVRRALASLARDGVIVRLGELHGRRCHWRLNVARQTLR